MHPVLFTLPIGGGFPIHIYGVMGALGFLSALIFITRESRRHDLDPDIMTNLAVGAVLAGLVGSRLLFVILNWKYFDGDPWAIINLRDGGLVFLGGVIGALGFCVAYVRAKGLSVLNLGDIVLPGLALAQSLGRVGCLSAGCCHGRPTTLPWGITFDPTGVGPLEPGVHYHPVQVYESTAYLLLFVALAWLLSRRRFHGQVFLAYFIAYGVLRFSLELLRGDPERGFVLEGLLGPGTLSTSQAICIAMFVPAALAYAWLSRRAPPDEGGSPRPAVAGGGR